MHTAYCYTGYQKPYHLPHKLTANASNTPTKHIHTSLVCISFKKISFIFWSEKNFSIIKTTNNQPTNRRQQEKSPFVFTAKKKYPNWFCVMCNDDGLVVMVVVWWLLNIKYIVNLTFQLLGQAIFSRCDASIELVSCCGLFLFVYAFEKNPEQSKKKISILKNTFCGYICECVKIWFGDGWALSSFSIF